jgi:uncharacterized protein (DUF924 family)
MSERSAANEVLVFWFGDAPEDEALAKSRGDLCGGASVDTDREIAARFGALREQAIDGGLAHWATPQCGWLALIIAIDQVSRSIFRVLRWSESPTLYRQEPGIHVASRARACSNEGVE